MRNAKLATLLVPCALACAASSCASEPDPGPDTAPEPAPVAAEPPAEAAPPSVAKAPVTTLEFEVEIAAPVETVWDVMLDPEGYTRWTGPFQAGSYFEGTWAEGTKMRFLVPGENGMVAVIAENRPHEVLSIRHDGYVVTGTEITTGDQVTSWAPAYETYRFASVPGGTRVTVEQDVLVSFEGFMRKRWPMALAELKALCEVE